MLTLFELFDAVFILFGVAYFLSTIRLSRTHSVLRQRSSQLQKYRRVRQCLVEQRRLAAGMTDTQGQGRTQGVWVKNSPPELDILQKLYYLCKGDCFRIIFAC